MSEGKQILYTKDEDGIATLTLNRPEKSNAFTSAMLERWIEILAEVGDDTSVKVLVVAGAGKAFCAGGDSSSIEKKFQQDALFQKDSLWRRVHKIPLMMERIDKPVIAAINGVARGAGLDMALMCDIRIMSESATLAESYIDLGLIAGNGGTYFLPRLVGLDKALEIFWTGRTISAHEAERIGMVTRVVPEDQVLSATYDLARKIASQPFEAVRAYKRATYQSVNMSLAAHLDMVSSHQVILRQLPEHTARVQAFVERMKKK